MIGIIGAMHEEIIELKEIINNLSEETISNITFFKGTINNKKIILVESGIGKVNSAVCATLLINHFKVKKIIFTGVAGGVDNDIEIGDIVISTKLIEHDFDVTAFGLKPGVIPRMKTSEFTADENLRKIAKEAALDIFKEKQVREGIIVSGDQFISSIKKIEWLKETFNASCAEMEGASIAHVCYMFNIPFVILRAISDKADHNAKVDFPTFVKKAAKHSKEIVLKMLEKL
ncbi:adenosylhomocysteine nucleosidase [Hypnocyclicus thermotrophus]|uniref:adenosylhomocysteine nucleosidase n=1 Tax=Hypnocyclicus thermotrophus TaxID=1627895 RepID=A0AA46DZE7_9FUSO|nr:5'-methylthioadenosine/adenosylhomocysteine nucleosidase [Hypnocyclicus thermotrophus]TDT71407.1 adenosylhomocysteine nucleosidase [Hypnocyclicus thermotrophus]